MANVSRINGFRPSRYLNGAPYNGAMTKYFVTAGDATAIGIGDLVSLDGGATPEGTRSVTRAAAGGIAVGAVVGVSIDPTNLNTPQYRLASTARYVYVADDPAILFEAQADSGGGELAAASMGLNVNFVVADASTITGQSAMQVDTSTVTTTATMTLKLIEFVQRVDNEFPATAASKVLVKINSHALAEGTGQAGI